MMRTVRWMFVIGCVLTSTPWCWSQCAGATRGKKSNLTIMPIDRSKSLADLDAYYVKSFVDLSSDIDRSQLFGRDRKVHVDDLDYYAASVPYGRYRIVLQSKSSPDSFGRLIDVCQAEEEIEIPRQFARVHIVPLLADSNSVEAGTLKTLEIRKFQNSLDLTDLSNLFEQGVADKIPYGPYCLETTLGLGLIKREVDVFQPDVWVFSGDNGFYGDSDISGPANIVRGELKNIPSNEKPVFMIMSGIYFPYIINSATSDDGSGSGSFSFVGANPSGQYMLYTIGKSGVLDAREFGLPRDSGITIDLLHPNPPVKVAP